MLARPVLLLLALLWGDAAAAQYSHIPPSQDGTGIVYMGREVAQVMGHEGADWLERPEREVEERPATVIEAMQLGPKDVVADIGAGTGYFSIRIARRIPEGQVLAEDIQPEMLDSMHQAIVQAGAGNVKPVLGTTDDPHLPAGSVDKVLMVNSYHEWDKPLEMMQAIVRSLKPDGQVIFVEYRGEDSSVPIKPLHKMTVAQLSTEMEAVGLHLVRRSEDLPWQHILVFARRP